jgi:hypothetical protein
VSQISPPIRIFLAIAIAFLVAWMTVLKPKSEDVSTQPITTGNVATGKPAESTPGKMAEKAKGVVTDANNKQSAAMGEATGSQPATATKPATGTATAPGKAAVTPAGGDLAGVPAPVAKAIREQKVLVIGFFSAKSSDDRDVRKEMMKIDRWNGRVFVTAAPIEKISRWGRIARGVDVQQSPTIVVVGADLKATPLVGYVDTRTIEQAVVDTMRNTTGIFTSGYLRSVNHACARASQALFANPVPNDLAEAPALLTRENKVRASLVADLRGIRAPARYKAFKAATVADAVAMHAVWVRFARDLGRHPTAAVVVRSAAAASKQVAPVNKRFGKRMSKNHVLSCVDG